MNHVIIYIVSSPDKHKMLRKNFKSTNKIYSLEGWLQFFLTKYENTSLPNSLLRGM